MENKLRKKAVTLKDLPRENNIYSGKIYCYIEYNF